MKKNKQYITWGLTAFFVILASLIAYYIIFHLDNFKSGLNRVIVILMPILDGIILAYLLTPLLNIIERKIVSPVFSLLHIKRIKHKRFFSVILTLGSVVLIIYGFFALVIPQIVNSIETIIAQFPSYVDKIDLWVSTLLEDNPQVGNTATSLLNQYSTYIEDFFNERMIPQINNIIMTVSLSVYSVFKDLWNLIIGFIISVYLMGSKERFAAQAKKIAYATLSVNTANRFISNVRFSSKTFSGFFIGKILDSIIIGFLCFVVTRLLGTPFPVLISVIIGVTNIVPFFGPFLGAIPSLVLILLISPLQALYFLLFVIVLQQVDGNIIGPKILGSSTGLPGFWVIFSITLFGGLFGILGMILGVPIFAVIFAFIKSLVESKLEHKELPKETTKYLKLLYIDVDADNELVNMNDNNPKPFEGITQIIVRGQERWKIIESLNIKKSSSKDDALDQDCQDDTKSTNSKE